ncbi:MAG: hypothetical protein C9356_11000 [Oleiphilus sp.]|nr:MAG: hypothetical protein C9356_11000 [Oleiphilus sp.]
MTYRIFSLLLPHCGPKLEGDTAFAVGEEQTFQPIKIKLHPKGKADVFGCLYYRFMKGSAFSSLLPIASLRSPLI